MISSDLRNSVVAMFAVIRLSAHHRLNHRLTIVKLRPSYSLDKLKYVTIQIFITSWKRRLPSRGFRKSSTSAPTLMREPFVSLRVPKIFNLRTDPYERAGITSNTYYDWVCRDLSILGAQFACAKPLCACLPFSSIEATRSAKRCP